MTACKTCELLLARDNGAAPPWDSILRSPSWDVVHSYDTAIPGWTVLVARRHITAVDELSDAEAAELGVLVRRVSAALREITGCVKTYVVQFAEAAEHPHVHVHVIPRMPDLPADLRGPRIFAALGVPPEQRVGEAAMNAIAARMQAMLQGWTRG